MAVVVGMEAVLMGMAPAVGIYAGVRMTDRCSVEAACRDIAQSAGSVEIGEPLVECYGPVRIVP